MMSRCEALSALLIGLRNESIDDFADLFYSVASDAGVTFDHAESYFDFMDPDALVARIVYLRDEVGVSETLLIDGILSRVETWLFDEAARSRRQFRHNRRVLERRELLPESVAALNEQVCDRLLSEAYEKRIRAMRERFILEKAQRFSESQRLTWEERE